MESSGGSSRSRPKSATLHSSFSPTMTFLAARSCGGRRGSREGIGLHFGHAHTNPVDEALLSKIVHPHGYINHVLYQLLHRSTVGLGQRDKTCWLQLLAVTLAHSL